MIETIAFRSRIASAKCLEAAGVAIIYLHHDYECCLPHCLSIDGFLANARLGSIHTSYGRVDPPMREDSGEKDRSG